LAAGIDWRSGHTRQAHHPELVTELHKRIAAEVDELEKEQAVKFSL